jgi:hypothetical protein
MALATLLLACTASTTSVSNPNPTVSADGSVSQTVGTAGGTVTSADGDLTVDIPAGALPSDLSISVKKEATSPAAGNIGAVYEIGPTGTQFAKPVTLTFNYGSLQLELRGTPLAALRVATIANGAWSSLDGFSEDQAASTVSGTTTHLSPYTIIAGALVCVDMSQPKVCDGGCVVPTCAGAGDLCGGYPGSTQSCTDSPDGFTASCCFAEDVPVCETVSLPNVCDGGTCTSPACGSTDVCGQLAPGSSPTSCNDTGNGVTATCCYAPGTPFPSPSDAGAPQDGGPDSPTDSPSDAPADAPVDG